LAITLPLAFVLNVWKDDAYTLHTTASTLGYAFHQSIAFEQNAPLYFLIIELWRHVNASAVWARMFSVLCGAAVVATVPALLRRYLPEIRASWVTPLVALNPALIWAALEIRVYALIILLSSLLMLAFYDYFIAEAPSRKAGITYAALCLVAAYTQFYLLFLIAAQGVIVLLYRRSALLRYAAVIVLVFVALLPLAGMMRAQASNAAAQFSPPAFADALHILARAGIEYFAPIIAAKYRLVVYAIVILATLPALAALLRYPRRQGELIVPVMFAGGLLLFATVPYAIGAWLGTRHPSSLLIPGILSAFAVFTFIRAPVRARVQAIWVYVMIGVQLAGLFATYRHLAKEGDWKRVVAFIRANEKPDQPIFVFQGESALPFEYYYHGPNRVIAVPEAIDFKSYELRSFELHSPRQAAHIFNAVPNSGRAWLITSGACVDMNIDYGCGVLERYVSSCCSVARSRTFYEATVRLLETRQTNKRYVNYSQRF
jgi:hypothetical protein